MKQRRVLAYGVPTKLLSKAEVLRFRKGISDIIEKRNAEPLKRVYMKKEVPYALNGAVGAHVLKVRNVNHALFELKHLLRIPPYWRMDNSRAGKTMEWQGTFITEYERPRERVLFDAVRDANPFFHFFEALWILDGRADVAFLSQFNSRMAEFSDDGIKFHAPYGYRIRFHKQPDQLREVIRMLTNDPGTRRAVMQIWDADVDLNVNSKDIPCNDMLFFKQRDDKVNMTVLCRSNDAVWGAYGANAVHFSFLHEFIAHAAGYDVGTMTQVSDSFHVYTERADFAKFAEMYDKPLDDRYSSDVAAPYEIIEKNNANYEEWLMQLNVFLRGKLGSYHGDIDEFFTHVAQPLMQAWTYYKQPEQMGARTMSKNERIEAALTNVNECQASDWRIACTEWLERRRE